MYRFDWYSDVPIGMVVVQTEWKGSQPTRILAKSGFAWGRDRIEIQKGESLTCQVFQVDGPPPQKTFCLSVRSYNSNWTRIAISLSRRDACKMAEILLKSASYDEAKLMEDTMYDRVGKWVNE